jgi:uncharacterized membrane protein
VGQVTVTEEFPATVHVAETCWYDTTHWADWVDGLERVEEVSEGWPAVGAHVRWRSGPAGRGEVLERVSAHEPLAGQTVEVSDAQMDASQSVRFTPADEAHVSVSLTLTYQLRRRTLFTPLVDLLFIRPALRNSLRATLARFGRRLNVTSA